MIIFMALPPGSGHPGSRPRKGRGGANYAYGRDDTRVVCVIKTPRAFRVRLGRPALHGAAEVRAGLSGLWATTSSH